MSFSICVTATRKNSNVLPYDTTAENILTRAVKNESFMSSICDSKGLTSFSIH